MLRLNQLLSSVVFAALLIQPSIAVADSATPSAEKRDLTIEHHFDHEFQEPMETYKDPIGEAWSGGWRGALIGLGAGVSVSLIQAAITNHAAPSARLTSGLTGAGFLAGAIYGGCRAHMINSSIDEQRKDLYQRFGAVTPTILSEHGQALAGLSLHWDLH